LRFTQARTGDNAHFARFFYFLDLISKL